MRRLRMLSDYAQEQGIAFLDESEANTYGEHSRESAQIAATLKSDHFGLVFDPANYSMAGEDALASEKTMHPSTSRTI